MSIKLIALDMDNTLLNRQKLVSPKNKEAIYKAMQNGVHVTIATGRMPASASYFAKNLGMKLYLVMAVLLNRLIVKILYLKHIFCLKQFYL